MSEYWKIRTKKIRDNVRLRSLVDYFKVPCQSEGEVTQLHCPFHGNDTHASARIYETNTMYCWVCSKNWDVISFTKDFKNYAKFSEACKFLEELYNIEKPDVSIAYKEPSFEDFLEENKNLKDKDFQEDFNKLSKMLIRNKHRFTLEQYTKYFFCLDNLYSNYKINNYITDMDIKISLDDIHKKILKYT